MRGFAGSSSIYISHCLTHAPSHLLVSVAEARNNLISFWQIPLHAINYTRIKIERKPNISSTPHFLHITFLISYFALGIDWICCKRILQNVVNQRFYLNHFFKTKRWKGRKTFKAWKNNYVYTYLLWKAIHQTHYETKKQNPPNDCKENEESFWFSRTNTSFELNGI